MNHLQHFDANLFSTGQGYAEDYYLDAKSQCAGGRGSCPDRNIRKGKVIEYYSNHCKIFSL